MNNDYTVKSKTPWLSEWLPKDYSFNGFKILDYLGHGGFGIVYLVCDVNLGHERALKEFFPREIASRESNSNSIIPRKNDKDLYDKWKSDFLKEAKRLSNIKHDNIIEILHYFEKNNTSYIVMPYYKGDTLKDLFEDRNKQLDSKRVQSLLTQLLNVLEYIHGKDIIHRDIKPSNIFLVNDKPLLIDFGSARSLVKGKTAKLTTSYTPSYAPFEQYSESGIEQGYYTDIYSLAASFYELITGGKPPIPIYINAKEFHFTITSELNKHRKYYPKQFIHSLIKALSFFPRDRFQSAEEWKMALIPRVPFYVQIFRWVKKGWSIIQCWFIQIFTSVIIYWKTFIKKVFNTLKFLHISIIKVLVRKFHAIKATYNYFVNYLFIFIRYILKIAHHSKIYLVEKIEKISRSKEILYFRYVKYIIVSVLLVISVCFIQYKKQLSFIGDFINHSFSNINIFNLDNHPLDSNNDTNKPKKQTTELPKSDSVNEQSQEKIQIQKTDIVTDHSNNGNSKKTPTELPIDNIFFTIKGKPQDNINNGLKKEFKGFITSIDCCSIFISNEKYLFQAGKTKINFPVISVLTINNDDFFMYPGELIAKSDMIGDSKYATEYYQVEVNHTIKAGESVPVFLFLKDSKISAVISIQADETVKRTKDSDPWIIAYSEKILANDRVGIIKTWRWLKEGTTKDDPFDFKPINIPKIEPINIPKIEPINIPKIEPINIPKFKPINIPKFKPINIPEPIKLPDYKFNNR